MRYSVYFERVKHRKEWCVYVVESPSRYVVSQFDTKSLVKALRFWVESKRYWGR